MLFSAMYNRRLDATDLAAARAKSGERLEMGPVRALLDGGEFQPLQSGRHTVLLSLSEAQSVRFLMHTRRLPDKVPGPAAVWTRRRATVFCRGRGGGAMHRGRMGTGLGMRTLCVPWLVILQGHRWWTGGSTRGGGHHGRMEKLEACVRHSIAFACIVSVLSLPTKRISSPIGGRGGGPT